MGSALLISGENVNGSTSLTVLFVKLKKRLKKTIPFICFLPTYCLPQLRKYPLLSYWLSWKPLPVAPKANTRRYRFPCSRVSPSPPSPTDAAEQLVLTQPGEPRGARLQLLRFWINKVACMQCLDFSKMSLQLCFSPAKTKFVFFLPF